MELEVKDGNIAELLNSNKPMVVDFWAPWCGPCKQIAPVIEELAAEYEGRVIIGKCDVDENTDLPLEFGIRSIPTFIFFKDGKVVNKHVGATQKATLKALIDDLL